jgi:hypothetical protein
MKQEVNRKHAADKWALDDVVMTSEVGRHRQGVPNQAGSWVDQESLTARCAAAPHPPPPGDAPAQGV